MIDGELRTKLLTLVTCPISQNTIYQGTEPLRVWYIRAGSKTERHMDGSLAYTEIQYDIEVHSTDINETSTTVETIKNGLDGTYGNWGAVHVHGCWVEDHNDTYEYQGITTESLNAALPLNVAAVKLKIII